MESLKFDIVRIGSVSIKYRSPVFKKYTALFTYTILKVVSQKFPICRYVLKDESFADRELNWDNYAYVEYKVFETLDDLKAYIQDYCLNHTCKSKYDGDFE